MRISPLSWSGDEWEEYVHALLVLCHGHANYQRIPARHRGDCGIESFATDGTAYQSYAAQAYNSVAELVKKQKTKITNDIRKFSKNSAALAGMFEDVKIRRWTLVVPEHNSREVVEHAATKSREVKQAGLSYVHPEFRVVVVTDDAFPIERAMLENAGTARANCEPEDVSSGAVASFISSSTSVPLLRNLSDKLLKLPSLANDLTRLKSLNESLTRGFVSGQANIHRLREQHPTLYQKLRSYKLRKERALAIQSLVNGDNQLATKISSVELELKEELPALDHWASDLAVEAIADWLMRCPLDFPETTA